MRFLPGLLALLLGSNFQLSADILYTVTDLGTLPGYSFSFGTAINDAGQVTGSSSTSTGTQRAFLYSNGQMTDLGAFSANGINNAGQVVGGSNSHAFLYSNGQIMDLGTLPGYSFSEGFGINDAGQVTGYSSTSAGPQYAQHAFLYSNGQMTDLGPGYANGINNAGQVVGNTGGFLGDAVLYSNGQMTDLGTLPGPSTTSVRWWGVPSNSPAVVLSPFTPFFTRTGK